MRYATSIPAAITNATHKSKPPFLKGAACSTKRRTGNNGEPIACRLRKTFGGAGSTTNRPHSHLNLTAVRKLVFPLSGSLALHVPVFRFAGNSRL